ncbi:MAG: MBL fold metallo-hydrolase [Candidatus Bathyarchaeales archaeon]
MLFRQVQKHGDNFSYVIADEAVGDAAVVDPSFNAGELIRMLQKERLALRFIINTHGHSDHTAGNAELRSMFAGAKTVVHRLSRVPADLLVDEGDVLYVGAVPVKVIHTPGHTPDSICLLVDGKKLLTGDTLFVGECGRTDLPSGNARSLYDSLFNKLLRLDDAVEVYPGHDYGVRPSSTIGEERRSNYTLQPRSLAEFVEFMRTP